MVEVADVRWRGVEGIVGVEQVRGWGGERWRRRGWGIGLEEDIERGRTSRIDGVARGKV